MKRLAWWAGKSRWAAVAVMGLGLWAPSRAMGQTWTGGRTTPPLTQLVTIDATGEPGWLYGQEDVVGDGLQTFKPQEQSLDLRTAYAATDSNRFWIRAYVSETNAVGGNVTVYVFIDADQNTATGGTAAAPEINSKLTADTSPGGYDYVVGVRGNGSITQIWTWDEPQGQYIGVAPDPAQAEAEIDQDVDPIQINGDAHGYVQGMLDLALVGLTPACQANLYLRSVNAAASLGTGDLEVGQVAPCVPADQNGDGVPDIVVPQIPCMLDEQCPSDGICVGGQCVIPIPCLSDTDCLPDEACSQDGYCVVKPGGSCTTNADCVDLVCSNGTCVACLLGGSECGSGKRCSASGRCVDDPGSSGTSSSSSGGSSGGVTLGPDEEVQGGALTCTASASGKMAGAVFAAMGIGAGALFGLRRRSSGRKAKR